MHTCIFGFRIPHFVTDVAIPYIKMMSKFKPFMFDDNLRGEYNKLN